jgi:hypothetical protein
MSNLTTLTLDQIIYYNGISKTIEVDNKKVVYSVSLTYSQDTFNLLTSKVTLSLKQNKKTILNINLDKLKMVKDNKASFKEDTLDLSVFNDLIENLQVEDLSQVDQNLYIVCQLIANYIPLDDTECKIVMIPKSEFFNLVVETGKQLESLNIQHTLEFSLMYRYSLKQLPSSNVPK